jgi:hypothetical protein
LHWVSPTIQQGSNQNHDSDAADSGYDEPWIAEDSSDEGDFSCGSDASETGIIKTEDLIWEENIEHSTLTVFYLFQSEEREIFMYVWAAKWFSLTLYKSKDVTAYVAGTCTIMFCPGFVSC